MTGHVTEYFRVCCQHVVLAMVLTSMPHGDSRAETAVPIYRETGTVQSDGETIYYERIGQGPALVLSHGLGGNHAIWYQQVPEFAKTYSVITWDQRGFGRSSNRGDHAGPEAAVVDLAAVLDHLSITQAHLVGQSMGGWAVMGFALKNPERVLSLVLADTIGGIYTPEIAAQFDAYIKAAMTAPRPDTLPLGHHPAIGEQLVATDPAKAFLYTQIGSTTPPAPPTMALQLRQTAWDTGRIASLRAPVLFVVGANDPIFPPAMIRAAAALFTGSRVVEIPDTGHSPYFEAAEQWNREVSIFLGEPGR